MLFSAETHPYNPPESWMVVKVAEGCWRLCTADGEPMQTYPTRKAAEADKLAGPLFTMYEQEGRWYAGGEVRGWRPYAEVQAENERRMAWLASRSAE